eukprot:gene14899-17093_t
MLKNNPVEILTLMASKTLAVVNFIGNVSKPMDANLLKLRLTPLAVKLLEEKGIKDFASLVESQEALSSLRTHLNPIQQSKLNALIKDFESAQDEEDCNIGDKILLDSELKATRQEIISQLELERQCLEEINSLILEESALMSHGAKQLVQKSKAVHQARATRLNIILRSRPVCDSAAPNNDEAHPRQTPRAMRKLKLSVRFKKENRPKPGPRKAIYNSPRAREGVSNIFSGASVFNAFSVAKDVVTDFLGSVTSGGKSQRDEEPEAARENRTTAEKPMETTAVQPSSAEPIHIHPYNTRRAAQPSQMPEMEDSFSQPFLHSSVRLPSTLAESLPFYSTETETEMERATEDRTDQMEDSEYVSVSSPHLTQQENFTREWREALLMRLGGLCFRFAQCNSECESLVRWRREWMRAGAALDFESMRLYNLKSRWQMRSEYRQHEAAEIELKMKESQRWNAAFEVRNQLLAWNREALQLNLSLAINPDLDQTLWLQSVVVYFDPSGFVTVAMQHS